MAERLTLLFAQFAIASGVLGGWFYLVDHKIISADSLETFLGTTSGAVIAYFFHTANKGS